MVDLELVHIQQNKDYKKLNAQVLIKEQYKENWSIQIPKIDLSADIREGTTEEILNEFVGHFIESPNLKGNVCLAAHNRGYNVNFFQRIKELEKGDEIYYFCENQEKIYEVERTEIIKETDWIMLENTEDNRITLITCLEDEPEYRRCIQAIEREEIKNE